MPFADVNGICVYYERGGNPDSGRRLLLVGRGVDAALGHHEQPGDHDHRTADQQRRGPAARVGEEGIREEGPEMDRTAVAA